jgi:glutathione reductase (NADPH)
MPRQYDLAVVGTGTAASIAAHRCRAAGWRVVVIDHLPFGGTCALRGCDPKKVLVGIAEALDLARRMRGKGIAGGDPAIDWPQSIAFKRSFTDPVPHEREETLKKNGIDALHGRARFTGPRTVEVNGESIEARFVLIAAGAVPMRLGIPGEEHLATSTDFLELVELPRRIVFVGGGYIAAEFSHVAVRGGAEVTVLEQADNILPQFDPDLVGLLKAKSASLGIDLRLGTRVVAIEKAGGSCHVRIRSSGAESTIDADLVVHAGGRVPDLGPLNLEAAQVEQEKGRLKLNDFLQSTSNPAVYAAGDAASRGPPLTPVASHDARVAAANMLEGNREKPNYLGVPSVVFTLPPLTRVGLLEEEARRQNRRFSVQHKDTSSWYAARRVGEECAGFKVLVEEGTDLILGAHLIGPHAEEATNLFALAIRTGLTAGQLRSSIYDYPTAASDITYML